MSILQKIDNKLMASISDFNSAFGDQPKIFTIVAAIWMPLMALSMYPFPKFMAIFIVPAILFVWASHIYEWRVWYRDNKQREIKQPRFFPSSVSLYRKWLFFLAIIFAIINGVYLRDIIRETDFIKIHFSWFIIHQFFANTLGAIIIIELIRPITRTGATWTDRKHIALVAMTAAFFFVLSTGGLLYAKKLL